MRTSLHACPEGITFTTQAQIDNFQTNYPDCTEIEGGVNIEGSNITNLNGLSVLTSIGTDLWIVDTSSLTSLNGLNNLVSIGGTLFIGHNHVLTSLSGLESLTSIGSHFTIYDNALINLNGLDNLTSIGGFFEIICNYALTSLDGLEDLTSIGGYFSIYDNSALTNISSLENLINVGDYLGIANNNSLSTCEAQGVCNYLSNPGGGIFIYENDPGCNSVVELANACGGSMPCLPYGNYNFTSQADIDSFQSAFPGCTDLEGNVSIKGSDITNLSGLNNINSIGVSLVITDTDLLDNLSGLENLSSVGSDFWIGDEYGSNASLSSLSGLNNLTSIGGSLLISNNEVLTHLTGLESLTDVEAIRIGMDWGGNSSLLDLTGLEGLTDFQGTLEITGNNNLTSLAGLENLTSAGSLFVNNNNSLINLSGLEDLTSVGYHLSVTSNNSLTNLSGLENLTTLGGVLQIIENDALTGLTSLESLTAVGEHLLITGNDILSGLTGLENLMSIGGNLDVSNNSSLYSLIGLDNIEPNSIWNLRIANNPELSTCDVESICDYLAIPGASIEIHDNATGCNSPEEVEEHCLTTVEELETGNGITIIPIPSNDNITLSSPLITGNTQLLIINVSGEKVLERQLTDTETQIDISALPRGAYFVRVHNKKMVEVTKVVKQ